MVAVVLPLGQQFEEDLARFRIEVGRRLVHDEEVGIAPECDGDEQLLLLAAGELDEGLRLDPFRVEAQPQSQIRHASRIAAAQRRRKVEQLPDRHPQGRRQLGHESDACQNAGAVGARRLAVDRDAAVVHVLAQQAADQGGLAGAVGADQRHPFAEPDLQADVVEDLVALERLRDAVENDHVGVAGRSSLLTAACSGP
ncbi:MAG: hypothetical protein MZW92_42925 [Comamonadaceae bacterium]|nr:hypothetical protein [Comamonadaceae bacterium]